MPKVLPQQPSKKEGQSQTAAFLNELTKVDDFGTKLEKLLVKAQTLPKTPDETRTLIDMTLGRAVGETKKMNLLILKTALQKSKFYIAENTGDFFV